VLLRVLQQQESRPVVEIYETDAYGRIRQQKFR